MNLKWLLGKGIATAANVAASKIPLHQAPKTRPVQFRAVPIHPTRGVFLKHGTGDKYVRVSRDEACPLEPEDQRKIRYLFNLDQVVDLCL